jgi:hypothetical protein
MMRRGLVAAVLGVVLLGIAPAPAGASAGYTSQLVGAGLYGCNPNAGARYQQLF